MNCLIKHNPAWDLDRVFSHFFEDEVREPKYKLTPATDVVEKDDNFQLFMELPGISKQDVDIKIKDKILTISNSTEKTNDKETKEEKDKYLLKERKIFTFERSFRLPDSVDAESIKADFTNGVLHLEIPKAPESKPKQIQISS
jgi:HSP20 family protein